MGSRKPQPNTDQGKRHRFACDSHNQLHSTSTPLTCSRCDPALVCEGNEVPVADLPLLEHSHERSHWRKPGRHTAAELPLWSDTAAAACVRSRKQAKPAGAAGTMALYGLVCLPLCNGHSCAITHLLQTALGCCDHALNTTSS